jgi:hypothetical protein
MPNREEKRARWFPLNRELPDNGVFELGLVLGGTVSAGAYTAGALDLLIEAMDAWHGQDNGHPPHRILLKNAAGSSGGAVCSALLALVSNRDLEHIHLKQSDLDRNHPPIKNVFWNLWVDSFEFSKLVDSSDIGERIHGGPGDKGQHVAGILNASMIDEARAKILQVSSQPATQDRPWVDKAFRVGITVTNLPGVPYRTEGIMEAGGYAGENYWAHDDYAWFTVPTENPARSIPADDISPDSFNLSDQAVGFATLADWATASGALPIGLKARSLSRPVEHYAYRPRLRVAAAAGGAYTAYQEWPEPDWSVFPDTTYTFTAVDGGCFNNNPVRMVHADLAGMAGVNPSGASDARRAMLMIDPLVAQPSGSDGIGLSAAAVAGAMIGTFTNGARYLTADLERFSKNDVYSRFQLVPSRIIPFSPSGKKPWVDTLVFGEQALAGTDLGAVGGWCSRRYRVHDFLLGRTNMLAYLKSEFILKADNPLFNNWSDEMRRLHALDSNGKRIVDANALIKPDMLPILPTDGIVAEMPDWPTGALDLKEVEDGLGDRLDAVIKQLRKDNVPGLFPWAFTLFASDGISSTIAEKLVDAMRTSMSKRKL